MNDIVNVDDTATNIYDIPLTISQQGQYVKNISKNVAFGGKQKLTRTYKCSKCGSTKHNLQKCPYKYIKSNNLLIILYCFNDTRY